MEQEELVAGRSQQRVLRVQQEQSWMRLLVISIQIHQIKSLLREHTILLQVVGVQRGEVEVRAQVALLVLLGLVVQEVVAAEH